jgi:hypothetical protein
LYPLPLKDFTDRNRKRSLRVKLSGLQYAGLIAYRDSNKLLFAANEFSFTPVLFRLSDTWIGHDRLTNDR